MPKEESLAKAETDVEAVTSRTAPTLESHSQHTPGPWRVEPAVPGEASGVHVFASDPNGSAADGDVITIADFIESDANARLIAAAPDLLAMLKLVAVVLDAVAIGTDNGVELLGPSVRDILSLAVDVTGAIAKSEGRG